MFEHFFLTPKGYWLSLKVKVPLLGVPIGKYAVVAHVSVILYLSFLCHIAFRWLQQNGQPCFMGVRTVLDWYCCSLWYRLQWQSPVSRKVLHGHNLSSCGVFSSHSSCGHGHAPLLRIKPFAIPLIACLFTLNPFGAL